tara:strand:+ start:8205 stop:8654 length:450 start_codon:yes stop_codon:yes gene_type:complete
MVQSGMDWNIIYTYGDMRWTIYFDKYIGPGKTNVFTTAWCDFKDLIAHNTPMSERIISNYYGIPIDKLKSEIYDYEDQLLKYVNNTLAKHQLGRMTKEEMEENLEILLSSYVEMYMHEFYYLAQEMRMAKTKRLFEERHQAIAQNNSAQ